MDRSQRKNERDKRDKNGFVPVPNRDKNRDKGTNVPIVPVPIRGSLYIYIACAREYVILRTRVTRARSNTLILYDYV